MLVSDYKKNNNNNTKIKIMKSPHGFILYLSLKGKIEIGIFRRIDTTDRLQQWYFTCSLKAMLCYTKLNCIYMHSINFPLSHVFP